MKDLRVRPAEVEDFPFLATMLGEAAVWRPDKLTPTGDQVLADPRYAMYLTGWPRHGDYGLVAEHDGRTGAAWYRTYSEASHGHGFVAADIPELSIAVVASSARGDWTKTPRRPHRGQRCSGLPRPDPARRRGESSACPLRVEWSSRSRNTAHPGR